MKKKLIFDPIYGFIRLTPLEWEIIQTPYYQRLRWIKQLGFSFYIFPGAEHSRYGHSIGVMFNAHHILHSCQRAVSDEVLFANKMSSKEEVYHQSVRVAALLHDLGTFPFSHTTEMSYIRYGETTHQKGGKGLSDDHEHLGAFIIKNTNKESGITTILRKYGIDPQVISDLVKGVDPSILANQILHSELDCDRMDYLLRDAHYTGLKYGSYDRDYLLHHFSCQKVGKHDILTINKNALHSIEDFLMARFAWYSQVIKSPRGAKYDAIAARVCGYLIKHGYMYKYSDLLNIIESNPVEFFGFNDMYFINLVHKHYLNGDLDKAPHIKSMAYSLLFKTGTTHINLKEFNQRLINQNDKDEINKYNKRAIDKGEEIINFIKTKGKKEDWVISDFPQKNITFVASKESIIKNMTTENVLLERDPVKVVDDHGDIKLLVDTENSIINKLQNNINYLPNLYCSKSAYDLLKENNII